MYRVIDNTNVPFPEMCKVLSASVERCRERERERKRERERECVCVCV